jgi:Predicted glycosyl hydrolase
MGQPKNRRSAPAPALALALAAVAVFCGALAVGIAVWLQRAGDVVPDDSRLSAPQLTAWIAEWQWEEGLADFREAASRLDRVQLFGVYFDDNDRLHVTERLHEMAAAVREAAGRGSSGRDASGRDASGWDVSGRDASGWDVSGRDASGWDASGWDASGWDVSGREASGREASGRDASGWDASGREASGRDASGWDASGWEAGEREAAWRDGGVRVDLTIVNDVVRADGTSTQKDPALLSRRMASAERRGALIDRIAALAEAYRADGVEIDFERVRDEDWEAVIRFYGELHRRLAASNRHLRVVLEPRAPIEKYAWPEGPEYVMMAYNLHGPHSGPGPKADEALIRKLAGRLKRLPGSGTLALAAGGFDWSEAGGAAGVTEREALDLARRSGAGHAAAGESGAEAGSRIVRDDASGSVHFDYVDDNGLRHTVWYADRITLERWIKAAQDAGIDRIALWKLGGFAQATLDGLRGGTVRPERE